MRWLIARDDRGIERGKAKRWSLGDVKAAGKGKLWPHLDSLDEVYEIAFCGVASAYIAPPARYTLKAF